MILNLSYIFKYGRALVSAVCLMAVSTAFADVLILSSGERLKGEIVSQKDGVIVFKHPVLGEMSLTQAQATVVPTEAADIAQQDNTVEAVAAVDASPAASQIAKDGNAPAPSGDAEAQAKTKTEAEREQDIMNQINEWRKKMLSFIPEGMDGKLTVGYSYLDTGNTSENLDIGFLINYKKGRSTYSFDTFYNYATSESTVGVRSTTTDKYGAGFLYRYDLDNRWYLTNNIAYLHDEVLQINHQVQDNFSVGYIFLKTNNLTWAVTAGPAIRYADAVGLDSHWFGLGVFREELVYQLTKNLSFTHNATYSIDPGNADNYAWAVYAGFTMKITEWVEASLAYDYIVNKMVGPFSQDNEQRIILALGFPF